MNDKCLCGRPVTWKESLYSAPSTRWLANRDTSFSRFILFLVAKRTFVPDSLEISRGSLLYFNLSKLIFVKAAEKYAPTLMCVFIENVRVLVHI